MSRSKFDMECNNDITNADVYDLLMTLKDTVQITNQIVKENSQEIKDIKTNISFLAKSTTNTQQESQDQSANVTNNVARPTLPPAKAEEIEPIISKSRLLGNGLFGPVYKGYYKGQPIALKVLEQRSDESDCIKNIEIAVNATNLKEETDELVETGDIEGSIALYTEKINHNPSALRYCIRSSAYYRANKFQEALKDAYKALELDGVSATNAYAHLADSHFERKDYQNALKNYKKFLAFNPNDITAMDRIEECRNAIVNSRIKRFSEGKPIRFNSARPCPGGNEYADSQELTHSNESESDHKELLHEIMIMHSYPAKNILPLVTYCLDPPCLAYQYMENGTLYTKLEELSNPLNWKQKANMAVGVARGLRYLHANNIVHGNITSSNIFLDEFLEPKIGELGCSQLLYNKESKKVSKTFGTPYYLPNWYIQNQGGKVVRKQIDVYSYGIVLLEIMSEKLPGNQWRDSQNRTLRDFVNTDILNLSEPPEEYISPADKENRRFKITIETEEDGQFHDSQVDWANLMFDIGRQCTIHDQTPWKAPFNDPEPWKTMQQNDITMERIHETLEHCYDYYKNSLKLDETHFNRLEILWPRFS